MVNRTAGSGKTTLANSVIDKISNADDNLKIIHLDGDDLRKINKNKDYSKKGRINNISTAISIMRFLANKDYLCVVSIVAPYKFLRDELKRIPLFRNIPSYYRNKRKRGFFCKRL